MAFLSLITPSSPSALELQHSTLSCLLRPDNGGIVDDAILTRLDENLFYTVTNAGRRVQDCAYLQSQLTKWHQAGHPPVGWKLLKHHGLVALQGPSAARLLAQTLAKEHNLAEFLFGQCMWNKLKLLDGGTSPDVLISRTGYTGEDGFEISVPASAAPPVAEAFVSRGECKMAGLGARDTLRLEAGMCLYGQDVDETTTPVEASLSWIVAKDRREEGGFHGSHIILRQLKPKSRVYLAGVSRRRVGLIIPSAPARTGAEIVNDKGKTVGHITSGGPSPMLKTNIAMGYIEDGLHKAGTEVHVLVREKRRRAVVTKMPFVPTRYYKGEEDDEVIATETNVPPEVLAAKARAEEVRREAVAQAKEARRVEALAGDPWEPR